MAENALREIEGLRGYAAGEHVAASLLGLMGQNQRSIRNQALATLVKVNNEGASREAIEAMVRLLAREQPQARPLSNTAHSYLRQLFDRLEAGPDLEIRQLREAVEKAASRVANLPPPPGGLESNAVSLPIPELLARIEDLAAKPGDEQIVEECLEPLGSDIAVTRWCALRIAASIGRDYSAVPVERLVEPVTKLLQDRDEFVREQAALTLAALEMAIETNRFVARFEEGMRTLDRAAPSISRLEYAQRLVPLLTVPPMPKRKAVEQAAATIAPVPVKQQAEAPSHEAIIADLRDPQRRSAGLAALWLRDVEDHPEILPVLGPILFEDEEYRSPLPIFISIMGNNRSAPETAAALDLIAVHVSSPIPSVRRIALSPWRDSHSGPIRWRRA